MKEQKTVSMRKYQRARARAVMEREGFKRHINRRDGGKSYFALNWRSCAKIILKKKRT